MYLAGAAKRGGTPVLKMHKAVFRHVREEQNRACVRAAKLGWLVGWPKPTYASVLWFWASELRWEGCAS